MTFSLPVASAGIGVAAMTGLTGLLLLLSGVGDATAQAGLISGSVCATSGSIAGISDVAAANGRVVAAVAVARGGDPAALIALMTGLAKSGLRVLSNPNDPAGTPTPARVWAVTTPPWGSSSSSLGGEPRPNAWNPSPQPTSP